MKLDSYGPLDTVIRMHAGLIGQVSIILMYSPFEMRVLVCEGLLADRVDLNVMIPAKGIQIHFSIIPAGSPSLDVMWVTWRRTSADLAASAAEVT